MSDLEDDQKFSKFKDDAEEDIRPIDLSDNAAKNKPPATDDVHMEAIVAKEKKSPALPGDELTAEDEDKSRNIVKKGDFVDILKLVPSLKEITIGAGWELKNLEGDKIDVDLSCFLIDKTEQTRVDDDFVFYNQEMTLDGAVKHLGDSRTGDGDGDDEEIFLDLNGIPFDILRIALVLSIYDETLKGWNFGMVKDLFLRLVDKIEGLEIARIELNEELFQGQIGIHVANLVREGPKWYFEVLEMPIEGGLAGIAKKYGIILRENTG